MARAVAKPCKDCAADGITSKRKAPHPGPRCVTHHRARRSSTRDTAWERRLIATYGITAAEYFDILKYQGGRCAICQRATGIRKRLSVDHDHASGVVRGICCGPCNRDVLGHLRDDPEAFLRGFNYLKSPPAVAVIGARIAPV